MTKPSKYFPSQTPIDIGRNRKVEVTMTKEKRGRVPFEPPKVTPVGNMNDLLQATCAGEPKSAGSSPALRIACPVCKALAGAYCTKTKLVRAGGVLAGSRQVQQTIAHKKRREEEERTR